jgi:hypothetical protein
MMRSVLPVQSALLEYIRTVFYRELRDVYSGLPKRPRWFLMRKIARFESVKLLVNYFHHLTTQSDVTYDVPQHQASLFQDVDVEHVVECLRTDGVCLGLNLPQEIVEQIVQFSKDVHCYGKAKPGLGFYYHEKDRISHKLNINLSNADYYNTSNCRAIQMIVEDPVLLKIARAYLGGPPVHQGTKLRWSFATKLSDFEKYKLSQTFHYDLDDYCAMKFFFYLTDVGVDDGPHICISGSHKSKKFLHKLLRGIYNEDNMVKFYSKDRVKFIYGGSGYGFVEDIFIMHKGLTPIKNDRLILIIEYALRDYGMKHDRIKESQLKSIS